MKSFVPILLLLPQLALTRPIPRSIQCYGSSYHYDANVTANSVGESLQVKVSIDDQGGGHLVQLDSDPAETHLISNQGETVISFKGKEKASESMLEGVLSVGFQSGRLIIGSSSFGLQYCNN